MTPKKWAKEIRDQALVHVAQGEGATISPTSSMMNMEDWPK